MTQDMPSPVTDEAAGQPGAPVGGSRRIRRELILAGILIAVGMFLLPLAIYYTGQTLLGPYSDEGHGIGRLYGDIFGDLADGFLPAWLLVLSPWLGVQILRLTLIPLRKNRRASR